MLLLLALIFWITITGANYPSQWLSDFLFGLEVPFNQFFHFIETPLWLSDMLVSGYKKCQVSVMHTTAIFSYCLL